MSWFDNNQSFIDSYRNARRLRNSEEIAANDNDSGILMDQVLRAQQGQAIAGGLIAGLNGFNTIATGTMQSAGINDTPEYDEAIARLNDVGNYNYQNFDQLSNDYANVNLNPTFSQDRIRGMSKADKWGTAATSALTGATTGYQIGGVYGAAAGLLLGGAAGIRANIYGDKLAENKELGYNLQAQRAAEDATNNFEAAHERIYDDRNRNSSVHVAAGGGQLLLKEYVDKSLVHKEKYNDRHPAVSRIRKKDGTVYRIRIK